jgi:signal transduction protein with GAF and PtsI domain
VEQRGTGLPVFTHAPVRGRWRALEGPDDVLALMDDADGAEGIVALVREAGATFLAPIYHELTAIVCTNGTPRSHIGIMSREFQLPCVMACAFAGSEPADGDEVEVDCSGDTGVVRA